MSKKKNGSENSLPVLIFKLTKTLNLKYLCVYLSCVLNTCCIIYDSKDNLTNRYGQ